MSDIKTLITQLVQDVNEDPDPYSAYMKYEQVKNLRDNYELDVAYSTTISDIITKLREDLSPKMKKERMLKMRKNEIQEYYHSEYQRQIFILKLFIFFTVISLLGAILYRTGLVPPFLLMAYLGAVGSIAFVVIFYYLWDFYLRDNTIFDEYDFSTYVSSKYKNESNNLSDLSYNLLSC
jgi:hypothetical protein